MYSSQDHAHEVFRDISKVKNTRSLAAMYGACVYMACRLEGHPRTFKEICAVAPGTATKDIGRCYTFMVKVCYGQGSSCD